jgi:protein PhnA
MPIKATLLERSNSTCELCGATENLSVFEVPPVKEPNSDKSVLVCETCLSQIEKNSEMEPNHWRCLNDSMWSQVPAVQVTVFRLLTRLAKTEGWAQDLLDMMYMEDETRAWADYGVAADEIEDVEKPRDVNGTELKKGDDVTIIKDLPIKGSSQVIKQGTVVRGISLSDDPKLVSGKANGQSMYIIAEYTRKK